MYGSWTHSTGFTNKLVIVIFLLICVLTSIASAEQVAPFEEFTSPPKYTTALLSPSANRIAIVRGDTETYGQVDIFRSKDTVLADSIRLENYEIKSLHWDTEEFLIAYIFPLDFNYRGIGFYASISMLGSHKMEILLKDIQIEHSNSLRYVSRDANGKNVYFLIDDHSKMETHFAAVDVGRNTVLHKAILPLYQGDVLLDKNSSPKLNYRKSSTGDAIELYLSDKHRKWSKLDWIKEYKDITPFHFERKNRIVFSGRDESNITGIYEANTTNKSIRRLFLDDRYDAQYPIFDPTLNSTVGVHIEKLKPKKIFWEEKSTISSFYKELSDGDRGSQHLILQKSNDDRLLLYLKYGDRVAGEFYLYDRTGSTHRFIASKYPSLKSENLSSMYGYTISARDGLKIDVYTTIPKGVKHPMPTVVKVHGGPRERDYWGLDFDSQFLASQGYLVLQVNFRGSSGYGKKFMQHSFDGNWGKSMQDDITDATKWAIQEGIANKDKICIYGQSYGAYAAVMATIKEPQMYKCAIAYSGVYDLTLEFSQGDLAERASGRELLKKEHGNNKADLISRSPAYNTNKIVADLLIIHGTQDRRAPYEHVKRLVHDLETHDKPFKTLVKNDEGHGFYNRNNLMELYSEIGQFLKKNLK